MPPRHRPTAFDVSFGSEASSSQVTLKRDTISDNSPFARRTSSSSTPPTSSNKSTGCTRHGSSSRTTGPSAPNAVQPPPRDAGSRRAAAVDGAVREKRKSDVIQGEGRPSPRPEKRAKSSSTRSFFDIEDGEYIKETAKTVLMGEDLEDLGESDKPVRTLTHFAIFDPRTKEMVSLNELHAGTASRQCEAFGTVSPVFANEEDAGQDDDYEFGKGKGECFMQRLRTSAIFNFMIDYGTDDSLYIQTEYAWYALKTPLPKYRNIWLDFYRPHRIAQLTISYAAQDRNVSWKHALRRFGGSYIEELDEFLDRGAIEDAKSLIADALGQENVNIQYPDALKSQLFHDISNASSEPSSSNGRMVAPRASAIGAPLACSRLFNNGDPDLAVLRPENQNRTTVMPFVFHLAEDLFREKLKVLGRLLKANKEKERYAKLLSTLRKAQSVQNCRRNISFPREARWCDQYFRSAIVDGIEYKAGDYVLVPASAYPGREQYDIPCVVDKETVPREHTLADYFWFARIIYFDQQARQMHIQWMEHSSKSLLQEIHDPRELFLTDICDTLTIEIVEKVDVQRIDKPVLDFAEYKDPKREKCQFYYSFVYNQKDGSFLGISDVPSGFLDGDPLDNCPNCMRTAIDDEGNYPQMILNGHGISYRGTKYHVNDFAMFKTNDTVCAIGQIVEFKHGSAARMQGACTIGVQLLGRISDIAHLHPEKGRIVKDERHLFLTLETALFDAQLLLRRCRVLNRASLSEPIFRRYLEQSPYNFYVEYAFLNTSVTNWDNARRLGEDSKEPEICKFCYKEDTDSTRNLDEFLRDRGRLRAFDPFAGVGAFALAMQDAGCLKLTHAVEISPSAAITLKKNSPNTIVYNQCSNVILERAVKLRHLDPALSREVVVKNLGDGRPIPRPPQPGDIDCIIAGFPCQPHSRLNMFQKANDKKSHLMLNLLSWVEFLKPRFCFFENVRGFLQYGINGVQASRYKVEGGIAAGGLKFFICVMVGMGYQIRFATPQSGHYGTPQTRVRFFLIAARLGEPMPHFPQPLYHFPVKDALEIKLPHGLVVHPIHMENGVVPFKHITVDDAIGDLPRFDWANPKRPTEPPRKDPETHKRVPIAHCNKSPGKMVCRPEGSRVGGYHYSPRTLFQMKARQHEDKIQDLQHFTRVLKEETVARVVLIPLEARADYHSLFKDKDLPAEMLEWQYADPKSSVARQGFRRGLYGRLDMKGIFQTTVTNVEPTAKQSWVLNPYCKRMVTVRELARSQGFPDHFQFYCFETTNVKTMHREIGNAVPWPVGYALGLELRDALFKRWLEAKENAIVIDGSDD